MNEHVDPRTVTPPGALAALLLDGPKLAVTLGGPGSGKSCLLTQTAANILEQGHRVLHVAVDEKSRHVRSRYDAYWKPPGPEAGDEANHLVVHTLTSASLSEASLERVFDTVSHLLHGSWVLVLDGLTEASAPKILEALKAHVVQGRQTSVLCGITIQPAAVSDAPALPDWAMPADMVLKFEPSRQGRSVKPLSGNSDLSGLLPPFGSPTGSDTFSWHDEM